MENNNTDNKNQNSGCGKALLVIIILIVLFYFIIGRGSKAGNTSNVSNNKHSSSNIVNTINSSNTSKQSGKNSTDNKQHYQSYYDGSLGTCGDLRGTVLIVSVFVNDKNTSWDTSSAEENKRIDTTLAYLKTATDFLQKQAASYGSQVRFIFDWKAYPQLRYSASFASDMVTDLGVNYNTQSNWIKKNIQSQQLKDKFKADHILYILYFDTPLSNPYHCSSITSGSVPKEYRQDYIELIYLFNRFAGYTAKPSTYAHEIMHLFGAPDMYYQNDTIPQSYVDHLKQIKSEDIMFMVYDSEEIKNVFSPLDAYYTGIAPAPEEVSHWRLYTSEH